MLDESIFIMLQPPYTYIFIMLIVQLLLCNVLLYNSILLCFYSYVKEYNKKEYSQRVELMQSRDDANCVRIFPALCNHTTTVHA